MRAIGYYYTGILFPSSSLIFINLLPLSIHHHQEIDNLLSRLPLPLLESSLRLALHLTRRASSLALHLLSFALRFASDLARLALRLAGTQTSRLLGFLRQLARFLETRGGGAGDGFVGCSGGLEIERGGVS